MHQKPYQCTTEPLELRMSSLCSLSIWWSVHSSVWVIFFRQDNMCFWFFFSFLIQIFKVLTVNIFTSSLLFSSVHLKIISLHTCHPVILQHFFSVTATEQMYRVPEISGSFCTYCTQAHVRAQTCPCTLFFFPVTAANRCDFHSFIREQTEAADEGTSCMFLHNLSHHFTENREAGSSVSLSSVQTKSQHLNWW